MANERDYEQTGGSKFFYSVDSDGKLFRKANAEDIAKGKNLKEHTKTKGAKAGEIEVRKIVASIFGYPTAFWVKSSEDYGEFLIVELFENGVTSVLQISIKSSFASDLIRKVNNLKAGNKYEIQSWKMQATDRETNRPIPDKFISGISIKDETGNKIEKYITEELQKKILPLDKAPFYDKDSKYQSSDYWETYYKMLRVEFKNRVIPKAHETFAKWFEDNKESYTSIPENSDYIEPTESENNFNEPPFPIVEPVFDNGQTPDDDLPF